MILPRRVSILVDVTTAIRLTHHETARLITELRRLAAAHLELAADLHDLARGLAAAAGSGDRRGLVTLGQAADRVLAKLDE